MTGGCCPDTRVPASAGGEGKLGQKQNLSTGTVVYVAGDPSKPAVIVINDIFGMNMGRHYGIADSLAEVGFYVLMPDLFHGETDGKYFTMEDLQNGKIGDYVPKYPVKGVQADLDACYEMLKGKQAGMIGMCWGSWIIAHESARDAPITCGVMVHPAIGLEGMFKDGEFGGKPEDLLKAVKHKMNVFPCKDDPEDSFFQENLRDFLQLHELREVNHGFYSQGDLSDKTIEETVRVLFEESTEFLKNHTS